MPKRKQGSRVIERLNHFRCGSCRKWWSIGDAPKGKRSWFCPWCGLRQSFVNRKPRKGGA